MSDVVDYPLGDVMELWRPGSADWSWGEEAADVVRRHGPSFADLVESVARDGVRRPGVGEEPIMLGDDGRVWSGHRRILAAVLCGVGSVPVAFGVGG